MAHLPQARWIAARGEAIAPVQVNDAEAVLQAVRAGLGKSLLPSFAADGDRLDAETADELVMAVRHRTYPIEGVQFHPESVLTTEGMRLLRNFLARCLQPARA